MPSSLQSAVIAVVATAILGSIPAGVIQEKGSGAAVGGPTVSAADSVDWKAVDAAMGRAAVIQPGDVHRFNFPRSDLHVTAAGVTIKPAFALGAWVAMKAVPGGVIAMGDLVLTESELNPVIAALQRGGIEQTAIHHHLIGESPRVFYTHVHAHGDPLQIARGLRAALALTAVPPAAPAAPAAAIDLDTVAVAKALGYAGRVAGGVYQVSVPRAETLKDGDLEIPPSMGLATAINFQPTGGGKAAITGDFVMTASEVNPVIRTLRDGGIEVTSLHNHLLNDNPRLFFMHFWANQDAVTLARTLKGALDKMNVKRPTP
jgi:hypothetical protein